MTTIALSQPAQPRLSYPNGGNQVTRRGERRAVGQEREHLLLDILRAEALLFVKDVPPQATPAEMAGRYAENFGAYVKWVIAQELLDPELGRFDLACLAAALKPERDLRFQFLGLQTLCDRYFLHCQGTRFELPQAFVVRIAMGIALREIEREAKAIQIYDLLSSSDFMASTPARSARSFPPAS